MCTELAEDGLWPGMTGFVSRAAAVYVGIRVLGSAALAVSQVALGHVVAVVLHSYREWDVAGAVALAGEAGAVVADRRYGGPALPVDGLLVAAPGVAEQVLDWWRRSLD